MNPTTRHTPSPQQCESFLSAKIRAAATALRFVVAGALISAAAPAHAQCPLSFAAAVNYAAGANPYSVAVGDFNADGRPDLAVANVSSNNVSILLGNGGAGGTFQPAVNYAVGSSPRSVAVGDFNADGRPDLAVANLTSNTVSILTGNGGVGGTFQPAMNYAVGSNPFSVAVGDFNADGRPDLAVANFSTNNASVLLGNADGTFQGAVNYAVGTFPRSIGVGDFNADGRPDLAVANINAAGPGTVSILSGNGNGTFATAVNYGVGNNPQSLAVGDFNADGRPDLAVPNRDSNNVSIRLGNAAGTFQPMVNYVVGTSPISVAVGDFNGDGRPDLAVANQGTDTVSILLGSGGGGGMFQPAVNYAAAVGPFAVALGDFNADGRPDLAVANQSSNNVSILLNTSTGFPPPGIIQQPVSQIVQAGQNATIAVTANGFGSTLTYQWRKNGVALVSGGNIAGATSASLTFTPALLGDFASYDVQVTSPPSCGGGTQVTTSAASVLGVNNPCLGKQPSITQQPASQIILSGNAAMFTVAATSPTGGGPLSYQWRKNAVNLSNGGAISGATSATLTINPAALIDNGSAFVCIVTNGCGSTASEAAGLAVAPSCPADFNTDGELNPDDLADYIGAFFAGGC